VDFDRGRSRSAVSPDPERYIHVAALYEGQPPNLVRAICCMSILMVGLDVTILSAAEFPAPPAG